MVVLGSARWVVRIAVAALLLLCQPPPPVTAQPAELVVDNTDASVQTRGQWTASTTTAGFYGANYLFRVAGDGSASVSWPFPSSAAAGRYQVFARWSSGPNRAAHATYTVTSDAGAAQTTVNQQQGGGAWQPLGTFAFSPGKGQGVTLSDKADGVVVADAIRFLSAGAGSAAASAPASPAASAQQAATTSAASDPRFFAQTGYRVGDDAFWQYFQRRGGLRSFGYPVSNPFTFMGSKVQIFQRQVMQLAPDGSVHLLNLLDSGLLPYTHMNGSVFPAPDPAIIAQSPKPDAPDYLPQAMQFVRDVAPDTFDGEPVNFAKTFFTSVTAADAFPNGASADDQPLLPYFNLELWGLPTSRPAHDPTNPGFIYQRFQRGIMHYDKSCGCTQGLLLADYFKALLLNRNLPPDLASEARTSKLLGQFAPDQPNALARPADLPGSDLTNAFIVPATHTPSVTLDAGHGGSEIGTSHTFPDGTVLAEKDLNLRVMLRVRDLLQQAGYQVTTTRTTDSQVNADGKDLTGDGKVTLADDLQARIDIANRAGSDIFVSIHFNGTADPNQKGTYLFYDPARPFSDRSKALAQLVDQALVASLKSAGYVTLDHGPTPDTSVLGGDHYYLLSPKTDIVARPSQMPAIIGEGLFLTNPDDANALRRDAIVEAVAQGYVAGIKAYFAKYPPN